MVSFASTTPEPLFTSELELEMGYGTNYTSGTAAAAADVEGWATGNVVAAAAAAADCRCCATFNSASDASAEMEFVSVGSTSFERVSCVVSRAAYL